MNIKLSAGKMKNVLILGAGGNIWCSSPSAICRRNWLELHNYWVMR